MAIWYCTVLTHNVGFLSLMVKPFLSEKASAWANVLQWVDLYILSTITWVLEHTNIILWAPDQISPPSRSLWVELQCQKILSLSLFLLPVFFTVSYFKGSTWEFPPELPPPSSPAPLLLCMPAQKQIFVIRRQSLGELKKARAWESALPECKLQSQSWRFWPPHTPWPTTASLGWDRRWMKRV